MFDVFLNAFICFSLLIFLWETLVFLFSIFLQPIFIFFSNNLSTMMEIDYKTCFYKYWFSQSSPSIDNKILNVLLFFCYLQLLTRLKREVLWKSLISYNQYCLLIINLPHWTMLKLKKHHLVLDFQTHQINYLILICHLFPFINFQLKFNLFTILLHFFCEINSIFLKSLYVF